MQFNAMKCNVREPLACNEASKCQKFNFVCEHKIRTCLYSNMYIVPVLPLKALWLFCLSVGLRWYRKHVCISVISRIVTCCVFGFNWLLLHKQHLPRITNTFFDTLMMLCKWQSQVRERLPFPINHEKRTFFPNIFIINMKSTMNCTALREYKIKCL